MSVESKILGVMAQVGQLAPDSQMAAAAGGYPYLSGDFVTGELHPLFVDAGLAIYPREAEILTEREVQIGTKPGLLVRIRMTYRIVDVEDLDSWIDVQVLGEGSDTVDKAVSQAQTSAYKQALLRTFMISSGEASEPGSRPQAAKPGRKSGGEEKPAVCSAEGCGTILSRGQAAVSVTNFGRALCPHHQAAVKAEMAAAEKG